MLFYHTNKRWLIHSVAENCPEASTHVTASNYIIWVVLQILLIKMPLVKLAHSLHHVPYIAYSPQFLRRASLTPRSKLKTRSLPSDPSHLSLDLIISITDHYFTLTVINLLPLPRYSLLDLSISDPERASDFSQFRKILDIESSWCWF